MSCAISRCTSDDEGHAQSNRIGTRGSSSCSSSSGSLGESLHSTEPTSSDAESYEGGSSGRQHQSPKPQAPTSREQGNGSVRPSHVRSIFPCAHRPLAAEVLQQVFLLLRASDIAALSMSSRAAASKEVAAVVATSVTTLVKQRYGRANPAMRKDDASWKRDTDTLRHAELSHLASLVRASPTRPGKGYYLSKAWAGNLRRYVEAQARRRRSSSFSSNPHSSGKEKRSRGRDRAESNLMPPWPDVNADIMCQHGGLAHSSQGTRGKRQVVDKRVWRELAAFFPKAIAFRVESSECLECRGECASERQAEEAVRREREQEIALPALRALYTRKTGNSWPIEILVSPVALEMAMPVAYQVPPGSIASPPPILAANPSFLANATCPLLPGIYHLLPRCWLNAWRAYVRDPRAPSPRTLDTALLLCEGHGLLLAPPHVEEFLKGERRYLLGGLDPERSGCVCEVLTPEEWDALTLLHPCDLGVRFCIDPDNGMAHFNSRKCKSCDPCYIGDLYRRSSSRKISF